MTAFSQIVEGRTKGRGDVWIMLSLGLAESGGSPNVILGSIQAPIYLHYSLPQHSNKLL